MFALVAARAVAARELLHDGPRSLSVLSREHKDGWGIALRTADDWIVHRSTECAASCARYQELVDVQAQVLIAHVRQKTVGDSKLENTHPFRRGSFVFAHNGTVKDVPALVARSSPERLAQIQGDTDSERLFAFVLTCIDEAGDVETGVLAAVRALHAIEQIGSASFLLSQGDRTFAHRLGRSLFALVRHGANEERRTAAIAIASEQLTGEAWCELPERSVVAITGGVPELRPLAV
ncbi:MAG: class II glutamine amidotransferase [Kofleriaceae bacterium]